MVSGWWDGGVVVCRLVGCWVGGMASIGSEYLVASLYNIAEWELDFFRC